MIECVRERRGRLGGLEGLDGGRDSDTDSDRDSSIGDRDRYRDG